MSPLLLSPPGGEGKSGDTAAVALLLPPWCHHFYSAMALLLLRGGTTPTPWALFFEDKNDLKSNLGSQKIKMIITIIISDKNSIF